MENHIPEIHIKEKGGRLFTTSLDVAEKFGKRHDNVLDAIRRIVVNDNKRGALNFKETSYIDEANRKKPMFEMTRTGFSVLAMGFTGKKALEWKYRYEEAFSKMEKAILSRSEPRWLDNRGEGKISRREETDAISDFIQYAISQGSTRANFYYKHFTTATYKALFIINDRFPGSFRNLLTSRQLRKLAVAEDLVTDIIREGMGQGLFYRDVFQNAKAGLEKYVASVGISRVISPARQLPMTAIPQIEARA